MNVHELAAQMTATRYKEAEVRDRRLKEQIKAKLTTSAKRDGFTSLTKYRKHLDEVGKQNAIRAGYVPFATRPKRDSRVNLVDLDFLRPEEVDAELLKQANENGYEANVSTYLANDGHLRKRVPDRKKSLRKLEGSHGKDKEGNVKRIDPQFRLFHNMMADDE